MTTSNRSLVEIVRKAIGEQADPDCWASFAVVEALEAAGLPAAALEGVMNQTHVVVPRERDQQLLKALDQIYCSPQTTFARELRAIAARALGRTPWWDANTAEEIAALDSTP